MYIVHSEYINTESGEHESTYHGPFSTIEDAERWMNDQPDDPDMVESMVLFMNAVN